MKKIMLLLLVFSCMFMNITFASPSAVVDAKVAAKGHAANGIVAGLNNYFFIALTQQGCLEVRPIPADIAINYVNNLYSGIKVDAKIKKADAGFTVAYAIRQEGQEVFKDIAVLITEEQSQAGKMKAADTDKRFLKAPDIAATNVSLNTDAGNNKHSDKGDPGFNKRE